MANTERGEFTLVVGDQRYTLRLTTNACAEMEDVSNGRTLNQAVLGIRRGSVKDLRLLLWASLREHHPELASDDPASLKEIGKLVDRAGGLAGMTAQMQAFLKLNENPKAEDGGGGKDRPPDPTNAQAGSGVSSTSTPVSSV